MQSSSCTTEASILYCLPPHAHVLLQATANRTSLAPVSSARWLSMLNPVKLGLIERPCYICPFSHMAKTALPHVLSSGERLQRRAPSQQLSRSQPSARRLTAVWTHAHGFQRLLPAPKAPLSVVSGRACSRIQPASAQTHDSRKRTSVAVQSHP